jgi:hypothetical protein
MTRTPRRLKEHVRDTVSELPIHAARLAVMGVGRALLLTDRVRKDYREARESGLGPVLGRLKGDAENLTGMVVGKVAGNGKAEEAPTTSRTAADSEISVGKPKPAGTTRPPTTKPAAAKPAATTRPAPTPKPAAAPPARPAAESRPKPAARSTASTASATTAKPPKPAPKPKPAAKESAPAKPKPAAKPKATPAKTPAKTPAAKAPTAKDLPVSGYDEATLASVRARLRGLDARQVGELRDYERTHAARADFLRMYENRIAKLRDQR